MFREGLIILLCPHQQKSNLNHRYIWKGWALLCPPLFQLLVGIRYAAMHEGSGYPSVILSLDGVIPTRDTPFGVGGSIALTKSIDPAVLFTNFGYRHHFNDGVDNIRRLQPENQFNATFGIAYALNDTLTLSTLVSGVFTTRTEFDNGLVLPGRERYSLQFGLTSYLAKGLYIEPTVSFGLNSNSSDITIGVSNPIHF
jgi:hypothetical protein